MKAERKPEGVLAVVSGRAIDDLDHLFQPPRLRARGVHGAQMRFDPDEPAAPPSRGGGRVARLAVGRFDARGQEVPWRLRGKTSGSVSLFTIAVRNTAIVETVPSTWRQLAGHGFRAALRAIRVGVPAAANHPHRTARPPAAHQRLRTPLRGHSSGHRRALGQSAAFLFFGQAS